MRTHCLTKPWKKLLSTHLPNQATMDWSKIRPRNQWMPNPQPNHIRMANPSCWTKISSRSSHLLMIQLNEKLFFKSPSKNPIKIYLRNSWVKFFRWHTAHRVSSYVIFIIIWLKVILSSLNHNYMLHCMYSPFSLNSHLFLWEFSILSSLWRILILCFTLEK